MLSTGLSRLFFYYLFIDLLLEKIVSACVSDKRPDKLSPLSCHQVSQTQRPDLKALFINVTYVIYDLIFGKRRIWGIFVWQNVILILLVLG